MVHHRKGDWDVIWEASTKNRMEALSIHRTYVENQAARDSDDVMLSAELKRVKELQEEMIRISNNPRDRLVVVLKSRVAQTGAVKCQRVNLFCGASLKLFLVGIGER